MGVSSHGLDTREGKVVIACSELLIVFDSFLLWGRLLDVEDRRRYSFLSSFTYVEIRPVPRELISEEDGLPYGDIINMLLL